jgi:hypothetical protein
MLKLAGGESDEFRTWFLPLLDRVLMASGLVHYQSLNYVKFSLFCIEINP